MKCKTHLPCLQFSKNGKCFVVLSFSSILVPCRVTGIMTKADCIPTCFSERTNKHTSLSNLSKVGCCSGLMDHCEDCNVFHNTAKFEVVVDYHSCFLHHKTTFPSFHIAVNLSLHWVIPHESLLWLWKIPKVLRAWNGLWLKCLWFK